MRKIKIGIRKDKELLLLDENNNPLPNQTTLKIESDVNELITVNVGMIVLNFSDIEFINID